jgi:AhpD family alkylhydroperoxidase
MSKLHEIKQRLHMEELEPKAYDAMFAMEKYLSATELTRKLRALIKIRVSQINGCAYCIHMHAADARKMGEAEHRIYSLSAWRESPLYSEEERAAFALADEVTRISEQGVTEKTFQALREYFTDNQIAQLIVTINQINLWNRIAISTKMVYQAEE